MKISEILLRKYPAKKTIGNSKECNIKVNLDVEIYNPIVKIDVQPTPDLSLISF